MTIYVDNDVIQRLAQFDLLDALPRAFPGDVRFAVLPTARYRLLVNKPKRGIDRYGADVFARICRFIESATVVDHVPEEVVDRLTVIPTVDSGEAILFACAAAEPESELTTGDKRSLTALSEHTDSRDIAAHLEGRVIPFEQVLIRLIDVLGFEPVRTRVIAALEVDTATRAIFGGAAEEENTRAGLRSYIEDLRARTGLLLAER